MIYDGDQKRVLAARDAAGSQPLHWGVTDDGRFMFGSAADDLVDCNPTATPFPAGGSPRPLHPPGLAGVWGVLPCPSPTAQSDRSHPFFQPPLLLMEVS